jgi:hypothetical protein
VAAAPDADGLGKGTPIEAISEDTGRPSAMPAASPAAARQPLQGRKKEQR